MKNFKGQIRGNIKLDTPGIPRKVQQTGKIDEEEAIGAPVFSLSKAA